MFTFHNTSSQCLSEEKQNSVCIAEMGQSSV